MWRNSTNCRNTVISDITNIILPAYEDGVPIYQEKYRTDHKVFINTILKLERLVGNVLQKSLS